MPQDGVKMVMDAKVSAKKICNICKTCVVKTASDCTSTVLVACNKQLSTTIEVVRCGRHSTSTGKMVILSNFQMNSPFAHKNCCCTLTMMLSRVKIP